MKPSIRRIEAPSPKALARTLASTRWALVFAAGAVIPAHAEVFLVSDNRVNRVTVEVGPTPGTCADQQLGPGDFSFWAEPALCSASDPVNFQCNAVAEAWSNGQFSPIAFDFECETLTQSNNSCSKQLSALASSITAFTVTSCQEYQFIGGVSAGDGGTLVMGMSPYVESGTTFPILHFDESSPDVIFANGRLSPGDYDFGAQSRIDGADRSVDGPDGQFFLFFADCPSTLIQTQPEPAVAAAGQTAQFSVGASGAASASVLTYQWRKNADALVNDGHISGANTATLTIDNVQPGDVGLYSVVVSNGTIVEPSSYVPLALSGATFAGESLEDVSETLSLLPPSPNPFTSSSVLRYQLPSASNVQLSVFDVRGRKIRMLVDQASAEPGVYETTWNGEDASGVQSASGIYFVRLEAGNRSETRRIVYMAK